MKLIGLRTASPYAIKELTRLCPLGYHKTHRKDGSKLPYNGIFITKEIDNGYV